MTANDWVWFLNDANPTFNVNSTFRIGGDLAASFDLETVIDEYTFRMDAAEGVVIGAFNLEDAISEYGKGPGVYSKNAYDTMGKEWMKQNLVSTGHFIIEEWVPQNRAILAGSARTPQAPGAHCKFHKDSCARNGKPHSYDTVEAGGHS